MNPLDWTGPEFLQLYVAVLIIAIIAAVTLRWWLRGPGGAVPAGFLEDYPYEAAYLSGGERRAHRRSNHQPHSAGRARHRQLRAPRVAPERCTSCRGRRTRADRPSGRRAGSRRFARVGSPESFEHRGPAAGPVGVPGAVDSAGARRPGPHVAGLRRVGSDLFRDRQDCGGHVAASARGIPHASGDLIAGARSGVVPDSALPQPARRPGFAADETRQCRG